MRHLVLAALVTLAPVTAHADCALTGLVPKVLSRPDVVLAPDGGLVVGAVSEDRGSLDPGDVAIQNQWRFAGTKQAIEPTITTLAPGLAVYRADLDALELQDDHGGSLAKATRGTAKRTRLAAPRLASLIYEAPLSRRSIQRVAVTLDGEAPSGAIALVLADAKGKPRSWGPVAGTVLYPYQHRDCLTLPNGTASSAKGDRVTLFWIDEHGRASARTRVQIIK